ncbi:hypothetical protein [Halolamina sp.]|jgi:hypothetical protein|uniref:hypothetical protein n=1 Tax=Halolamina sp. TaxID=1940283 RepID=UPI000223B6B3|nr:hypothetical protein Halar_1248 [halophilic archaeon DL31]
MSLREAFGQARLLTLLLLAGMGWIVFTAVQVVGNINYWGPSNVGQTASVGIIGLVMLAAVLVLSMGLFSGLGSSEPAPQAWPPENDDI